MQVSRMIICTSMKKRVDTDQNSDADHQSLNKIT